ncbi:MAG TPA: hypothetical protein VG265_10355 [Gaiellaceae bacterium]|jgi:hypothetical protein|nr:hypothetical protein [Gaiellaceae bacterium]
MIARVARFEGIDVEAAKSTMDEAVSIIRPMVEGLDGYEGAMELVTPDGKFMSITFFASIEDAEAAEATFDEEMPAKLGHVFQEWAGHRVSVDRYEVYADTRG